MPNVSDEPTVYIPVRIPESLAERVEAYRRSQPASVLFTRSQAIRALMEMGLESVEKRKRRGIKSQ